MSHNITVNSGTSVKLKTAGKYCDKDIVVTAEGGSEDLDAVLTEQESLVAELKSVLDSKVVGEGAEPKLHPTVITPTKTTEVFYPHDGYDGFSEVTVEAISDGYIVPSGTKNITENGEHDVTEFASVNVNVASSGGTDTLLANLVADTLIELDDETVTTARAYAFYAAKNLQKVSLPNLTSVESYTFNGCENLISANLPNLISSTGTYCFSGCEKLTQVNMPNVAAISNYTFSDCTTLEKVELGQITSVGSYAFRRAGTTALIIRNTTTTLTKLNATNAFSDCPIQNGTGYIYFYRDYVERYKSATGWSNYAEQIRAIEDYPEICGGDA